MGLREQTYAGFNQLYENGRIQEAACWAHARRKFYDLQQAHASPLATEALERIGALYAIEKEIRGRPLEERREVRQARSKPLLDSLRQWFETTLLKLSRKSDTTAAIRYALSRWNALLRYSDDGQAGDRQQRRRTRPARGCTGPEELPICRIRFKRRARGRDLQPDRSRPS